MAVTPTPIFPQSVISQVTQFANADGTTAKSILPAQTNGCKIESIIVSSNNNADVDLKLYLQVSAVNYQIGQIKIPLSAGFLNTVTNVNLFTAQISGVNALQLPLDSNGNPYLNLASNVALFAAAGTTLTSGDIWNIVVMGGAF